MSSADRTASIERLRVQRTNFWITFGIKYRHCPPERWGGYGEPHPMHPDHVDGRGFVRIEAESEEDARELAVCHFGTAWAFIYDREPAARHCPLGELGVIGADDELKWRDEVHS